MLDIVKAVYRKNRTTARRAYPWSFIVSRITGGILAVCFPVFIYYFIFKGKVTSSFSNYAATSDYVTFIVLGSSVQTLSFATLMNVGRCLITEIREGTLDVFLLSSASRIGYFIGCYIEQFLRSVMEFLVILLVGFILGANIEIQKIILLAELICIASIAFFSVSILVSTIMVFTRDTYITQNTFFAVMALVSGVFFPVEYLPNWVQYISNIFPLTPILKLFRSCISGGQTLAQNVPLLVQVIALSLIYFTIGYLWFRKLEKKLVEEVYS